MYIAACVATGIVTRLLRESLPGTESQTGPSGLTWFALDVFVACCIAAAQAVAFSRMGREIDRPLWKIPGDIEPLKRFFPLWFALNLAVLAWAKMTVSVAHGVEMEGAVIALYLTYALIGNATLLVGACVMFVGRVEWSRIGADLVPLLRQLPATLGLCLFGFLGFFACEALFLLATAAGAFRWLLHAAAYAVSAYCDCVLFAGAWVICMTCRDMPEDVDFDF